MLPVHVRVGVVVVRLVRVRGLMRAGVAVRTKSVSTLSGVRSPCSPVLLGVGVFMCLLVRVFMSLLAAVVSTALLHWKYIV